LKSNWKSCYHKKIHSESEIFKFIEKAI